MSIRKNGCTPMVEIVKVQVPYFSSEPDELALVYADRHKNMTHQSLPPAARAALGDDFKAFFEAEFKGGKWIIGQRVADQDW